MEKQITISKVRSNYAKRVESNVRSLNSYLREICKDWDALHCAEIEAEAAAAEKEAKAAAKAAAAKDATSEAKQQSSEAKQKAEAARKRAEAAEKAAQQSSSEAREELRAICAKYNLSRADISLSFLTEWSFYANSSRILCDAKRVEIEAEAEARAEFGGTYEFKENSKGTLYMLIPVKIWSASKLLQKLTSAAAAREAAKKAESALQREREAAEKEAKRIEAYKARIAEYEAKQQRRSEAAEQKSE